MKPDWSKAPDWANWAAQEPSSAWYWYSERPTYSEICTEWQTKGRREIIPRVDVRPQATLESRPETDTDSLIKAAFVVALHNVYGGRDEPLFP